MAAEATAAAPAANGSVTPVPRWTHSAVEVRGGCKSYGSGKKKVSVLEHLNLTVPVGCIYGLLGPSGCGKTTLLGIIVNILRLEKGTVSIYGHPPGSIQAAVPGRRVGYMPQELALFQEFTIEETLQYFGRIHSLGVKKSKERRNFLVKFLDLPEPSRLVSQLSGGQQRRVSFAAALIHEPEILILDEPTVGVDPLLRTSIWRHLMAVSSSGNVTVLITTHYIEEARQAGRVGLMRSGRLLAEASPTDLLRHFNNVSLEEVFLRLCLRDGVQDDASTHEQHNAGFQSDNDMELQPRRVSVKTRKDGGLAKSGETEDNKHQQDNGGVHSNNAEKLQPRRASAEARNYGGLVQRSDGMLTEPDDILHEEKPWTATSKAETYFSRARFSALLAKNTISLSRNIGFLLLSFMLPPLQTSLFCLTVGGIPQDLRMAVTNLDTGITMVDYKISELYLNQLNDNIVIQERYDTYEEGYDSVEKGRTWGLLLFEANFTKAIIGQQLNFSDFSEDEGKIHVYMDKTNQQIYFTLVVQIYSALQQLAFSENATVNIPIKMEDAVYGLKNPTFTEFMAPGVILTITYFMAMALTAISFITEKKEGLYYRSWVAGVTDIEVMTAHVVTQLTVMLVQIALILVFMFAVFKIPCLGNILWVVLLAVLQGLCGMTFGLLISVTVKDEMTAMQASLGIFYPVLLLSGIVWPVQGMPTALRYISYILPQTYACDSIRAVLYKGWDITYFDVYFGYIITIVWMILHVTLAFLVLRIKK